MASDIATSQYGMRARRLVDLAEALRGIGAHELLNIPQIVVIGGQSAGKSSLVEAVSGIRVPRDSGTCTRCPMECNLKSDRGFWSCQISLRKEFDARNNPLPNGHLVPFGHRLTNPNDVELMLRRAQAALLCPWMDPAAFTTMDSAQVKKMVQGETDGGSSGYNSTTDADAGPGSARAASTPLKFSRNTICVEIKDSEVANLSFVDLPGLIQNEEPDVVQLVEGLVREFITKKCLILVTIPMSDDMENQRAKRLAKEADPEGVRTIGVLTKPDTLTSGSISALQKWKEILLSNSTSSSHHALKHGYFCVKLADDTQRTNEIREGTPRAERQALEMLFFASVEPWADIMAVPRAKERFGVVKLVSEMSRLLTALLDDALPGMRAEAERQLAECRAELRLLPNAPCTDSAVEVLRLVTEFCQDLKSTVYGGSGAGLGSLVNQTAFGDGKVRDLAASTAFVRGNRGVYDRLKVKIRSTAPDFRPFENGNEYGQPCYDSTYDTGKTRDLSEVRRVIEESITWELPHNVPFAAKQYLIGESLAEWDEPAKECLENVAERLEVELNNSIERFFKRYPKLKDHIGVLVMEELELHKEAALRAIDEAIALEKYPYYTLNTSYFEYLRDKWILNYRSEKARKNPRPPQPEPLPTFACYENEHDHPMRRAAIALAKLGYLSVTSTTLKRLLPPDDEYEDEITVMADVRAYFHVAYKRIIDTVPLTIEHTLNQALCSSLQVSLFQKLDVGGANASQRLSNLMAEDPKLTTERKRLQVLKMKLERTLNELRRVDDA